MFLLFTILCALVLLGHCKVIQPQCPLDIPRQAETGDIGRFGMDLYSELIQEDRTRNLFFSPTSLSMLMSMIVPGTASESEEQVLNSVFPESTNSESAVASMGSLHESLSKSNGKYELSTANGAFVEESFDLKQDYETIVKECLKADVRSANFGRNPEAERRNINNWVESKTNNKIKELFKPGSITGNTRMVLANAIHFKADWMYKFNKTATKSQRFYGGIDGNVVSNVDMMEVRKVKVAHSTHQNFELLSLPYNGKEVVMHILLPKRKNGLMDLEDELLGLSVFENSDILDGPVEKSFGKVQIPKFKEELSLDSLKENLIALGVEDIFNNRADFSRMTDESGLLVSNVVHKAFIQEGTEAAAASGAIIVRSQLPEFIADHPFVYLIQHKPTKALLFMGKYVTPN